MSRWFLDRRREFIEATLRQFGQIRRADIVREFGVTMAVASKDISDFMEFAPDTMTYDVSAKTYVFKEQQR